jgi:hypothetical protein
MCSTFDRVYTDIGGGEQISGAIGLIRSCSATL